MDGKHNKGAVVHSGTSQEHADNSCCHAVDWTFTSKQSKFKAKKDEFPC